MVGQSGSGAATANRCGRTSGYLYAHRCKGKTLGSRCVLAGIAGNGVERRRVVIVAMRMYSPLSQKIYEISCGMRIMI